MNPYSIEGNTKILEPLDSTNFFELIKLIANEEIRKQSLLYSTPYTVMNSYKGLQEIVSNPVFSDTCRLYLVKCNESKLVQGVAGLIDIDWSQCSATMLILMDKGSLIKKISHEPLKNILIKAIKEWNLRKITAPVYTDDQWTKTVFKGFGFKEEGTLREQVIYKNETDDIVAMGLLNNEFHYVED
jgi:RimJ/RimL family protein N-acetyltransferase